MATKTKKNITVDQLTAEQLGNLLHRHQAGESRKALKAHLMDLGVHDDAGGKSHLLDAALKRATSSPAARRVVDELSRERIAARKVVPVPGAGMVLEMINQVRAELEAQNVSQTDLAERTGIPRPQLNRALNLHHVPNAAMLARIAEAIGKRWTLV